MSDFLVNLAKNKFGKKILNTFGLPTPVELNRNQMPWEEMALSHKIFLTGHTDGGKIYNTANKVIHELGGAVSTDHEGYNGLLFDATGINTIDDLNHLYSFFHNNIKQITKCARILILANHVDNAENVEQYTVNQSIIGFTKTLAKEIGRNGSTANMLALSKEHLLNENKKTLIKQLFHFFLSDRVAYIDGQVITINAEVNAPGVLPFHLPLAGKTALVTGAARGIGASTAKRLAQEGAKVIILDIVALEAEANKLAAEIGADVLIQDISAVDAGNKIAAYLSKLHVKLDVLVHNAGITRDKTLAKMDEKKWKQVLEINLKAIYNVTEQLKPDSLNNHARIICLSSISGIAGNFGQANYTTTKAGIIGYVNALSKTLASKNITVNAIAPGFIETEMTAKMPFMTKEMARRVSNLSQGGLPGDIAEAITFLASPGAYSISGETIRVCGGNLIGA